MFCLCLTSELQHDSAPQLTQFFEDYFDCLGKGKFQWQKEDYEDEGGQADVLYL